MTYGQCVVVDQRLLRFDIDETLRLVQARAGARIDRGIGARLHVLTEGWPLGLQLALSIVLRGGEMTVTAEPEQVLSLPVVATAPATVTGRHAVTLTVVATEGGNEKTVDTSYFGPTP